MKTIAKLIQAAPPLKKMTIAAITTVLFLCSQHLSARALLNKADADTSVTACVKRIIGGNKTGSGIYFPESVKRFYQHRNFQPDWVMPQAGSQKTWESMLMLDCVLQFGLAHEDYHPDEMLYTRLHDILERPATVSNAAKAQYDIMLTDAMITFINHLHFGKLNPEYPAKKIDRITVGFQADKVLANALQQKDYMSAILDVQPKTKEYDNLQHRMHLLEGVDQGDCYEIPEAEVRKMAINMERLRWMNIDGNNYIQINIPSFTLRLYRPDTTYEFKIMAGKPATPSPVVSSSITYFTVGYKRKPVKDAVAPRLPLNKQSEYQGSNVMNNYNMQAVLPGAIFFWPASGNGIVLQGVTKLQAGKAQVATDGTIKIENGKKLAALLLENDNAVTRVKEIQAALNAEVLKNFMLQTPVPLRITYITCEMKDGILITYPDVYNKDKKLEMALYNTNQTLTMR